MRFLADSGVATRIVEWLRAQGHDATHLRDEGFQRMTDSDIFCKAATERRILLTFDLDFGEILALSRESGVSGGSLSSSQHPHSARDRALKGCSGADKRSVGSWLNARCGREQTANAAASIARIGEERDGGAGIHYNL